MNPDTIRRLTSDTRTVWPERINEKALDPIDFGWLCGILEGEGSFAYRKSVGKGRRSRGWYGCARLELRMGDRDIVERAGRLVLALGVRLPRLYVLEPRTNPRTNGGIVSRIRMYGYTWDGASAIALMEGLMPHLGHRRQGQVAETLRRLRQKPQKEAA